ncbi:MAG TPA: PD-(D/E)XK nuclease family protein [Planctomycetota bacterium]|nr:PD-(D/E)XK nuclease family protein [Planctomycetota bacterium]
MKLTASILIAQSRCGFLRHVQYGVRQPLPFGAARRRFGSVLHVAIAVYEKSGRRLETALETLSTFVLPAAELDEARRILAWRHGLARDPARRPFLIEGALHALVDGHRLDVRMDRLDRREGDFVLSEYKTGTGDDPGPLRAQMTVLSYAIARTLGRAPAEWEVELLGERRVLRLPAERRPAELERAVALLAGAVARDEREPLPSDPGFCRRCPARRHCPRATPRPEPLRAPEPPEESAQRSLFDVEPHKYAGGHA